MAKTTPHRPHPLPPRHSVQTGLASRPWVQCASLKVVSITTPKRVRAGAPSQSWVATSWSPSAPKALCAHTHNKTSMWTTTATSHLRDDDAPCQHHQGRDQCPNCGSQIPVDHPDPALLWLAGPLGLLWQSLRDRCMLRDRTGVPQQPGQSGQPRPESVSRVKAPNTTRSRGQNSVATVKARCQACQLLRPGPARLQATTTDTGKTARHMCVGQPLCGAGAWLIKFSKPKLQSQRPCLHPQRSIGLSSSKEVLLDLLGSAQYRKVHHPITARVHQI